MQIEVPLDASGLNEAFVKTLLESVLGKQIEDAIKKIGNQYSSNVIQSAVESAARDVIAKLVHERMQQDDMQEKMREEIAKRLTNDVVDKVFSKFIDSMRFGDRY